MISGMKRSLPMALVALLAIYGARPGSQVLSPVTSPRQQFGANIGDDYFLATYRQFEEYAKKIDDESDRVRLVSIGSTEEGRTQWMAIISSPENLADLDRYKQTSRRLALADGVSDEEARILAERGKAIVYIAGGLHADEVLGAQQLVETMYQLASASDPETLRVLRDVIVLAVHANPDGHALVADWYMREREPQRRTLAGIPRAYQKYVGHDNNRDFYLASQAETINMNRVLYREWFPQIVYDHHQAGPAGTVMFAPPFRGPFNFVFDPLIVASIDLLGSAMQARFAAEGKAGVTMRSGSTYSTWWNGGLRTTAYFHNQIGLLTETIGNPTPIDIPFVAARQVPSVDLPNPIAPQRWHFRQSIDYSLTANRAVFDAASRYRETLLLNAYRMARNSIARGSADSWLASPRAAAATSPGGVRLQPELRDPDRRAPRAYILPADQPDFLTATKFVDALLKAGVTVHRVTAAFDLNGRRYPAGSYVVKTAQAFRPHVLDMFEPQEHPDDVPAPGAPPTAPYDIAGWTLAFQMGVKFDRLLEAVDGPFETIAAVSLPRGLITGPAKPAGYLLSHHQNDAFIAVNSILASGGRAFWLRDRSIGGGNGTGSIYLPAGATTLAALERMAGAFGLSAAGVSEPPRGSAYEVRPVRVGLWDRYGGASTSGWIRWILERYEFPFEKVYVQTLDAGGLADQFDVLILPGEAVPGGRSSAPADVPAEYRSTTGTMSWDRTVPKLKEFVERGGTLIAIGRSTVVAESLGVPVSNALVNSTERGVASPLAREAFYIPGSVLRVDVDNSTPLAYGFETQVDVMFDNSPVFALQPSARARRVSWFGDQAPLRSGWAWGQHHLRGGTAIVDATVGSGRVLLFGPEIAFRAQPHGTFKFLFNGIHLSRLRTVESVR
jgi:hypothetical protein